MMDEMPEPVTKMMDALDLLPGVLRAGIVPTDLASVTVEDASRSEASSDLPHVALMRTGGGRANEKLLVCEISFDHSVGSLLSMEFLAWWVRDWARRGHAIQFRATALAPRAEEIQLGGTLKVLIEYFHVCESEDWTSSLQVIDEMAESIGANFAKYHDCFQHHVQPESSEYSLEELLELGETDGAMAYELYCVYQEGEMAEQDDEVAVDWLKKSAELGFDDAQFLLGRAHMGGDELIEKDEAKAVGLLRKAVSQDHPLAMSLLGECYSSGIGVEQDVAEAFKWFEQAAASGNPICLAELGECYEQGKGTSPDLNKALELYQRSFDDGFETAKEGLDRVKAGLES